MYKRVLALALGLPLIVFGLAGCKNYPGPVSVSVANGKAYYGANCAVCHGTGGHGAGPASLGLGDAPPALTGLSKQNKGRFPRAYVIEIIAGKVGFDHPTAAMPEFGQEQLGKRVKTQSDGKEIIVPGGLVAVTNYLESIQE